MLAVCCVRLCCDVLDCSLLHCVALCRVVLRRAAIFVIATLRTTMCLAVVQRWWSIPINTHLFGRAGLCLHTFFLGVPGDIECESYIRVIMYVSNNEYNYIILYNMYSFQNSQESIWMQEYRTHYLDWFSLKACFRWRGSVRFATWWLRLKK